jgi:hypothetical protein
MSQRSANPGLRTSLRPNLIPIKLEWELQGLARRFLERCRNGSSRAHFGKLLLEREREVMKQ